MICPKCKSEKFKDFDETFWVCRTCGTLVQKPEEITPVDDEVIAMAANKCKSPGCTKYDAVKGYCATHARENGFGDALKIRNAGGSLKDPEALTKILPPAVKPVKVKVSPTPPVADVGIISIIDAAWSDSRKRILSMLQTADNRKRLEYSLSVVSTIETLGL